MTRRKRKVRAYTPLGWKIASLAKGQDELARVLGLTQQSVSKKLRGDSAVTLADLERLARRYKVPMTYFFESDATAGGGRRKRARRKPKGKLHKHGPGKTPARGYRNYSEVGRKIASLAENQTELARALRVGQQTVSKKLTGKCAIMVADIERLAERYKVPMTYFFE